MYLSTTEEGRPAATEYRPHFPEPSNYLRDLYHTAMTARNPEEMRFAIQNLHVLTGTLRMLRNSGVFPEFFIRKFREDIDAARREVGSGINKANLKPEQNSLFFMMSSFENAFRIR